MRIISFAWTTPALIAGRKTVTRRSWKDSWAGLFGRGEIVQAYNRQPRFGGELVARIRLVEAPYRESTADMPDSDWEAEGFAYLEETGRYPRGQHPRAVWKAWRDQPRELWVVRFDLVEVVEPDEPASLPLFRKSA